MAGPWEQYQQPAAAAPAGPWTQYRPTEQQSEIPTGRKGYSLAEVPLAAGRNLPESAGKFVSGVVEAVTSPIQTLSSILDIGAGALRSALPQPVVNFIDKFATAPPPLSSVERSATAPTGSSAKVRLIAS